MERLIAAGSRDAIAAVLESLALEQPGCATASVLWQVDDDVLDADAPSPVLDAMLALARAAGRGGTPRTSEDGRLVAVPLIPGQSPTLLLGLEHRDHAPALLAALASPVRVAGPLLERALRSAELQDANERLVHSEQLQRALFAISNLAGSELDMPEMLRGIHAIVGTLMYAENFFIVLHDSQRETIRFLYFADVEDTAPRDPAREIALASREHTLTWYLVRDGKPLMGGNDALKQQVSGPLLVYGPDSNDWLGVPMLRDGHVRGALVVQSYRAGVGYSAQDMALLSFVGSHILTALERKQGKVELEKSVQVRTQQLADANRGLQEEILERQRAERLQAALFQLAQMATADISQLEFYQRVHRVVGELLNAENFFIALLTDARDALEFPYFVDARERHREARPLGRGVSEYVMRHGKVWMGTLADIEALAREGEVELQTAGPPALCWLGAPLFVGAEVIGLVAVQSYTPSVVYGAADKELLSFVASQIANSLNRRRAAEIQQRSFAQLEQRVQERTRELRKEILERERIQEQLKHQVMHDALTGLPNRGYLLDRLERVLAQFRRVPTRAYALLYLDVDRFKVINDSLGHLAGDEVLKEVTRRLLTCVREPDVVARLAGDEFAILLEDIDVPGSAVKVARRILEALGAPLQVAGKELEPTASVGIALADARYQSADEVLRDADLALYRAKALGRKRFELFDASLQKNAIDVLAMEGELRVAMQRAQFEPYFQPVVRLATGETVGYEALIRWNHPTRGVLAPGAFMRIAEDNGSIEEIDWQMFERSCRSVRPLLGAGMRVGINVSPLHLRRAAFGDQLLGLIERTGLGPEQLVIEITEGSLLDDPERVGRLLDRLRDAGIDAALDDFGTGYSSLSYLHNIPLRTLKIDRTFVARLGQPDRTDSATVISAVLAMARALGINVVAEGIETPQQRDTLLAMGCELGQGYLLGRPAAAGHWPKAG
jgi:diguanylate cyclase (GGDEF)-like protein